MLKYSSSEKKLVAFKNCFLSTLFGQKLGQYEPRSTSSLIFFLEITKGDQKLPITFYFIKILWVLTEL